MIRCGLEFFLLFPCFLCLFLWRFISCITLLVVLLQFRLLLFLFYSSLVALVTLLVVFLRFLFERKQVLVAFLRCAIHEGLSIFVFACFFELFQSFHECFLFALGIAI